MKFEYDSEADAGYIYLKFPIKNGGVKKSIEVSDNVIIDLDEKNDILGIEVLSVKQRNPELLNMLKKSTITA